MELVAAQGEMRRSYLSGGPGVFVSGLVWLSAALVEARSGAAPAFAALFVGGMLIFPLSSSLARFAFRRPAPSGDNKLGRVALESTIAMIGGLFAAYLLLTLSPALVFPVAAIAVGTHYFVFTSIYGTRVFWLLGAVITAVGAVTILGPIQIPGGPLLAVAAIELVFAVFLTATSLRQK